MDGVARWSRRRVPSRRPAGSDHLCEAAQRDRVGLLPEAAFATRLGGLQCSVTKVHTASGDRSKVVYLS